MLHAQCCGLCRANVFTQLAMALRAKQAQLTLGSPRGAAHCYGRSTQPARTCPCLHWPSSARPAAAHLQLRSGCVGSLQLERLVHPGGTKQQRVHIRAEHCVHQATRIERCTQRLRLSLQAAAW
jgi:hypothetical protein